MAYLCWFCQNLHWKLGQQTPSIGTLLAYLEAKAYIIFFYEQNFFMPLQSTLTFFQNISMITKTFKEAMSIEIKGIKVPADGVCCPNFSEGFDETHIRMPLQSALTFFKISQRSHVN